MPANQHRCFIYTEEVSNKVLFVKRALIGDYALQIKGVKTFIVAEDVGILKEDAYYTPESGFTFGAPMSFDLLKKKISTLLLLVTNMEMQKENIKISFSALAIEKFCTLYGLQSDQVSKFKDLCRVECNALFKKLDNVKSKYAKQIDAMSKPEEIDQFYKDIRDTVVMGSYVSVNKVKEEF